MNEYEKEELRVGSVYQYFGNDVICNVEQIVKDDRWQGGYKVISTCGQKTAISACRGVSITEEILLKCGFEAESKYDDLKLNGINIQSCSLICKTLERRGFFLNLGEENEKLNISIGYLHELQNLYYALTKEELDVSKLLK